MGNIHTVNCVLAPEDANNNFPGFMKRTCQRISFKRSGSEKSSSSSSSPPTSPKTATKSGKKYMVLNTMPRCSSFENLSTILPSSKKIDSDPTYLCWKRAFEQRRNKPVEAVQQQLTRMRKRVHNMSSAVSGHLTPKGFPAFVKKRGGSTKAMQSKAKKSLQQPELIKSPLAERKIPVMHSDSEEPQQSPTKQSQPNPYLIHHHDNNNNQLYLPPHLAKKVTLAGGTTICTLSSPPSKTTTTSSLSATSASAATPKYTLAPLNLLSKLPQRKQAIIIEQLYRDIKDMESRYDTQMDSYLI